MILDFKTVEQISKGIVVLEDNAGWLEFHRYTKAQRDNYLYTMQKPVYYNNALCTAGVRLAFDTDSEFVAFEYVIGTDTMSSGAESVVDLYINGQMMGALTVNQSGFVKFELGQGKKRVELYLPWSVQLKLREITVADGAKITPVHRKSSVIMYGDSITQGYYNDHPSLSYVNTFARLYDADVLNKGIGSERYLAKALFDADGFLPDFITIAYGTNDWNSCTYAVAHADCELYFEKMHRLYPDTKKIVITPIWRTDEFTNGTKYGKPFREVYDDIKSVCDKYDEITVVNGIDLVPHDATLFRDSAHPDTDGQRIYGENLYKTIKSLS